MNEAGGKFFALSPSAIWGLQKVNNRLLEETKDKQRVFFVESKKDGWDKKNFFIFTDKQGNTYQEIGKSDCLVILNSKNLNAEMDTITQKTKFGGTMILLGRMNTADYIKEIKKAGFRIIKNDFDKEKGVFFVVARKIFTKSKGANNFSAEIAEEDDFAEIAKMRYDIYCEEMGCFDVKEYPKKQEIDEYDKIGTHIILRKNSRIIGYFRLIPEKNGKFLMEESGFKIPGSIDRRKTIEASRMIIKKEERGFSSLFAIEQVLFEAGKIWSQENFYTRICCIMMEDIFQKKEVDWSLQRIGEPKSHFGKMVQPAIRNI